MTAPLVPVAQPDATRAVPPPPPNEVKRLQRLIADALANGYSRKEISAQLEADRGFTLADFERRTAVSPRNVARSGAMGATLGFADELAGLGEMMASGKGYGDTDAYRRGRDPVRRDYGTFRAAHPVVSTGAEMVGGLLPTLPAAGATVAAPSLLGAAARGGAVGAGTGAVAGTGYAETMADVPGDAAQSAALGGVLGALLSGGSQAALQMSRGTAGQRLERAIEAGGGEDVLRRSARDVTAAGRGRTPIGALSPYLRGEAEFAATRSPAVYGKQQPRLAQMRSGDAERLIRDVTELTDAPAVGREGLVAARQEAFGPVYDAIAKKTGPITDRRVMDILRRPYIGNAFQEAVNEGLVSAQQVAQPGFAALNNLRQHLRGVQERAFTAGDGARGAAFRKAADDLEAVLEDAVPEFKAVQRAYRDASRPINIIDLARLETARQGRASPALDAASRDLRRDLLREFGSPEKYRAFMRRVAMEGELAQFNQQVLGGSQTARRLESTMGVQPEDVAGAVMRPTSLVDRAIQRVVPRAVHERRARQVAPFVFAPASQFDEALRALRDLGAKQSVGPVLGGQAPSLMGLLSGSALQ